MSEKWLSFWAWFTVWVIAIGIVACIVYGSAMVAGAMQ